MVLFQNGTGPIKVLSPDQQLDLQAANACEPCLVLATDFALDSLGVQRIPQDLRLSGILWRING